MCDNEQKDHQILHNPLILFSGHQIFNFKGFWFAYSFLKQMITIVTICLLFGFDAPIQDPRVQEFLSFCFI